MALQLCYYTVQLLCNAAKCNAIPLTPAGPIVILIRPPNLISAHLHPAMLFPYRRIIACVPSKHGSPQPRVWGSPAERLRCQGRKSGTESLVPAQSAR